jgi:hypothetical protein
MAIRSGATIAAEASRKIDRLRLRMASLLVEMSAA